jgi:hypothetical protein
MQHFDQYASEQARLTKYEKYEKKCLFLAQQQNHNLPRSASVLPQAHGNNNGTEIAEFLMDFHKVNGTNIAK